MIKVCVRTSLTHMHFINWHDLSCPVLYFAYQPRLKATRIVINNEGTEWKIFCALWLHRRVGIISKKQYKRGKAQNKSPIYMPVTQSRIQISLECDLRSRLLVSYFFLSHYNCKNISRHSLLKQFFSFKEQTLSRRKKTLFGWFCTTSLIPS